MSCGLAHLDGAYVLGALPPAERLDYERHLPGCAECSRAVRELAGLPGLLAQVDAADLEPTAAPPLPATLLPALVHEVRRSQRRRSALVAALAASVAAVAVGALFAGGALDGSREPASAASPTAAATGQPGRPMVAVRPTPVRADLVVADVAWGTRLDVTCSYVSDGDDDGDEEEYEASTAPVYALVVRTRDGRAEQVATWRGLPGRTMRLSAATATDRSDIELVEMRTADGVVVLRLPV